MGHDMGRAYRLVEKSANCAVFPGCPERDFCLFASSYQLTRKRLYEFLDAKLVICVIFLELVFDILLFCAPVSSHCADLISPAPEMPVPVLVLEICVLFADH